MIEIIVGRMTIAAKVRLNLCVNALALAMRSAVPVEPGMCPSTEELSSRLLNLCLLNNFYTP
jgi:hypothetical protein